jgi:hypothetical protein
LLLNVFTTEDPVSKRCVCDECITHHIFVSAPLQLLHILRVGSTIQSTVISFPSHSHGNQEEGQEEDDKEEGGEEGLGHEEEEEEISRSILETALRKGCCFFM